MLRPLPHDLEVGGRGASSGGVGMARPHAPHGGRRAAGTHRAAWARLLWVAAMAGAALLLAALVRQLALRRLGGGGGADSGMGFDPGMSCGDRMASLGLDLDGPGASSHLPVRVFERQSIYSRMDGAVELKGLSLGGVITQGLAQADLFHFSVRGSDVQVAPVLRPLDTPVRAMILPLLQASANTHIQAAVERTLLPVLPPGAIWLQV